MTELTRFAYWVQKNDLTADQLGKMLQCSPVTANRYCFPAGRKNCRFPQSEEMRDRIRELTSGFCTADNLRKPYDPNTEEKDPCPKLQKS